MQGLHDTHDVIEDHHSLPLTEPLLLDDIVLEVNEVSRLVTEIMGAEAVQHQTDALLHLPDHPVAFQVFNKLTGSVLQSPTGEGENVTQPVEKANFPNV